MYDILVVGGGPAGMTAALYGVRNGKTVLVIEKTGFGGQITHSPKVENFPGTLQMSGNEFADHMLDQILEQGAEIELECVTAVEPVCAENVPDPSLLSGYTRPDHPSAPSLPGNGGSDSEKKSGINYFLVHTQEGGRYEARTVILATGVRHRMLGLPGENELIGEGISFCAVCDGDFYSGQTVCVAGGGNSALQEAILLSEKCQKVILLQDLPFCTGEQRLQEVLASRPNVQILTGVSIRALLTEHGTLKGVQISRKKAEENHCQVNMEENGPVGTGESSPVCAEDDSLWDAETSPVQDISCDGLFVAIGLIPENEPFSDLAALNHFGYFDSDEQCLTRTPGLFVAGDCRNKSVRQLTTAASDGAVAALAACRYLDLR